MAYTDIDANGGSGWGTGRALVKTLQAIAANFLALKGLVPAVRTSTAANYALQLGDNLVRANKGDGAQTVTVPTNATAAFAIGHRVRVVANQAQTVTIAAAGGVTIRKLATKSLAIIGQYGVVTLEKVAADEWVASGDFAAV